MLLTERHHQVLRRVRHAKSLSRRALHEAMGLRPNTIGDLVDDLLKMKLIREGTPEPMGRGRPQVPLHIDTHKRRIVGIAVNQKSMDFTHFDLLGNAITPSEQMPRRKSVSLQADLSRAIQTLRKLPQQGREVVSLGITFRGLIDIEQGYIFSAVLGKKTENVDFAALSKEVQQIGPMLVLDNDMHGIAAQWLFANRLTKEDTLLIYLNDTQVGAALLIDGQPNRGCILGGNELGHMRIDATSNSRNGEQVDGLEQVFSSKYLAQIQGHGTLLEAAQAHDLEQQPIGQIINHLATGIANCINFIRPNRVHLISPFEACSTFRAVVDRKINERVLPPLADRVERDWSFSDDDFTHAAAWLGMTAVYFGDWSRGYVSHNA